MSYTKKSRSLKDDDGNLILAAAFIIPALMAIGGLAIDLRRGNNASNELQASLDAAALAALSDESVTNANVSTFAQSFVTENMDAKCVPSVTGTKQDGKVTVSGTCILDTTLLVYINKPTITVSQDAIAEKSGQGQTPCVLALSRNASPAISINSGSMLNAPGCQVHANSSDSEAIYVNSQSSIIASETCSVGGTETNSGSSIQPSAIENCARLDDPFEYLQKPTNTSGCNHRDFKPGVSTTMSPGIYCKKTEIEDGITVTMLPGTYVFRKGELVINSGGKLVGSDVTLYFHDKEAYLLANSDSTVQLDAPDSGYYQGIVMFQNRKVSEGDAQPFEINSRSKSFLEGVTYLPKSHFKINSKSDVNTSASYSVIVANTIEVNSESALEIASDFDSGTPLPDIFTESEPRLTH
ncbi:MAG: pilus assembly protein TadG-related protein [Pseudomonadota bacterium]